MTDAYGEYKRKHRRHKNMFINKFPKGLKWLGNFIYRKVW